MKNQFRIAHHSAAFMLAIALGTLACIGLKATAMDDGVPYGRRLPAAVHHVAAGGVLVVACEHVTTTSASLVNTTWLNQESEVISLDSLIDGSLVNSGPGNLLCLRLDDGVLVWIAPGESLLAAHRSSDTNRVACAPAEPARCSSNRPTAAEPVRTATARDRASIRPTARRPQASQPALLAGDLRGTDHAGNCKTSVSLRFTQISDLGK